MPTPKKKRTIFLYSLEPWGDMWYSKHHYAASLAKNNKVFFVSLPERWQWSDLFSFKVKVRKVNEGLSVVEYRNNLPLRFLPNWLADRVTRLNALKIKKIVPDGEVIHWSFHPTRVLEHETLRNANARVIYHVVDPYQSLRNDSSFAKRSDLVVAINPWYLNYYRKLNSNCLLFPHGVRAEDRIHQKPENSLTDQWGKYAILATGLSHFVKYELVIKCAKRYPDLRFLILGQRFPLERHHEEMRDQLFALPNVTYLGVKHPSELKELVHGAAVGLLTYELEPTSSVPLTAGRTPLKVLTYLAQHCPVVSTNNSYIIPLENKGHFKAETEEHFVDLIGEVLDGSRKLDRVAVDNYLDSVDYNKLIDGILTELSHVIERSESEKSTTTVQRSSDNETASLDTRTLVPKHSPILIVSNEGWDGPRYSKHRYAIALNALRMVYFIDPSDHWRPSHLLMPSVKKRVTPEGISILSYKNAIPLLGGTLGPLNDWIISRRIRRYLKREEEHDPIFWSFDPSRLSAPDHLGAYISIYHCADDHAFKWRGERILAKDCDHVFCIARDLMPRFKKYNTSVHHVPHGLAESDIAPGPFHEHSESYEKGYGLYIGNINDRHDFVLWEKLIKAHSDVTWMIVGPVKVSDPIGLKIISGKYPNVILKPLVSYSKLKDLIANAAFGFLYMQRDHPANRISSQKAIQFLAQGKPLFCSWFSEYADHKGLVNMTDDHESALAQFAEWKANGEPPTAKEQRLEFARAQRFTNILDNLPFRF
ncbi:MAG: hypothetical protein WAR83_08040 [Flavobacteriales bacterium]|nr:hypothetical protein [Flavobacteriales bacterium]